MFETGFSELILLFVIGLLVLGPQRLPKVAAEIGKWVGRARRTANELRRQLEREIELSEVIQPPRPRQPPADTSGNSEALAATAEAHPDAAAPSESTDSGHAEPPHSPDTATASQSTTDESKPAEPRRGDEPDADAAGRTPPAG